MYAEVLDDMRSRAGICNDRPRWRKAGRRGVTGLSIELSSLDFRFSGSQNLGDGERVGGPPPAPSERERAFEGDREMLLCVLRSPSPPAFPGTSP